MMKSRKNSKDISCIAQVTMKMPYPFSLAQEFSCRKIKKYTRLNCYVTDYEKYAGLFKIIPKPAHLC